MPSEKCLEMPETQCLTNTIRNKKPYERSIWKQITLGLITNITNIAPSMSLGFSAVTLPHLITASADGGDNINIIRPEDIDHPNWFTLTAEQASWFASIASLATPIGCLASGPISDRFGRKSALHVVNAISFVGWLTIACGGRFTSSTADFYAVLLVGRFLTGISTGLASMPATIYMAEVATTKLRGVFCTWASVSFAIGVLLIYGLGAIFKENWDTMALIVAAIPILSSILIVCTVPESPSWLAAHGHLDASRKCLSQLYTAKTYTSEIQEDFNSLLLVHQQQQNSDGLVTTTSDYLKPATWRAIIIVTVFFLFQQLAGTHSIVFYAIDIVQGADIVLDPYVTIVLIGAVRLVAAALLSYASGACGRRTLAVFSAVSTGATLSILASYGALLQCQRIPAVPTVPLVALLLYFFTSTLGLLPLPFAMAAELLPPTIKGTASGGITAMAYMFSFGAVKLYPEMVHAIGVHGVFGVYGASALVATGFLIGFLPETRGKTLEQIQAELTTG